MLGPPFPVALVLVIIPHGVGDGLQHTVDHQGADQGSIRSEQPLYMIAHVLFLLYCPYNVQMGSKYHTRLHRWLAHKAGQIPHGAVLVPHIAAPGENTVIDLSFYNDFREPSAARLKKIFAVDLVLLPAGHLPFDTVPDDAPAHLVHGFGTLAEQLLCAVPCLPGTVGCFFKTDVFLDAPVAAGVEAAHILDNGDRRILHHFIIELYALPVFCGPYQMLGGDFCRCPHHCGNLLDHNGQVGRYRHALAAGEHGFQRIDAHTHSGAVGIRQELVDISLCLCTEGSLDQGLHGHGSRFLAGRRLIVEYPPQVFQRQHQIGIVHHLVQMGKYHPVKILQHNGVVGAGNRLLGHAVIFQGCCRHSAAQLGLHTLAVVPVRIQREIGIFLVEQLDAVKLHVHFVAMPAKLRQELLHGIHILPLLRCQAAADGLQILQGEPPGLCLFGMHLDFAIFLIGQISGIGKAALGHVVKGLGSFAVSIDAHFLCQGQLHFLAVHGGIGLGFLQIEALISGFLPDIGDELPDLPDLPAPLGHAVHHIHVKLFQLPAAQPVESIHRPQIVPGEGPHPFCNCIADQAPVLIIDPSELSDICLCFCGIFFQCFTPAGTQLLVGIPDTGQHHGIHIQYILQLLSGHILESSILEGFCQFLEIPGHIGIIPGGNIRVCGIFDILVGILQRGQPSAGLLIPLQGCQLFVQLCLEVCDQTAVCALLSLQQLLFRLTDTGPCCLQSFPGHAQIQLVHQVQRICHCLFQAVRHMLFFGFAFQQCVQCLHRPADLFPHGSFFSVLSRLFTGCLILFNLLVMMCL